MRVIDPKNTPQPQKRAFRGKKTAVAIFITLVGIAGLVMYLVNQTVEPAAPNQSSQQEAEDAPQQTPETIPAESGLRLFTDNEFKVFFDNLLQKNTNRIPNSPPITGETTVDAYILQKAEERGYRLRQTVDDPTLLVTTETALGQTQLQPDVLQPWLELQAAILQEGLELQMTSGYRSVDEQLDVFLDRVIFESVSTAAITTGSEDEALEKVLARAAPPGYSKHHSGYTIDLFCPGFEFRDFKSSTCHKWLSSNNYENAKNYGFIPSYPSETDLQGPDPEAWEYIYVGEESLSQ